MAKDDLFSTSFVLWLKTLVERLTKMAEDIDLLKQAVADVLTSAQNEVAAVEAFLAAHTGNNPDVLEAAQKLEDLKIMLDNEASKIAGM